MCLEILGTCLLAAQLTGGDIAYNNTLPKYATSYDGVKRDISELYKDEQINFNLQGYLLFENDTLVSLGYDHGIDTKKYDISKEYTINIRKNIDLNDDWSVIIGGSTKLGGKVRHTPCYDQIDREYYCGNLTAWSDFEQPKHERKYSANITFTYKLPIL